MNLNLDLDEKCGLCLYLTENSICENTGKRKSRDDKCDCESFELDLEDYVEEE